MATLANTNRFKLMREKVPSWETIHLWQTFGDEQQEEATVFSPRKLSPGLMTVGVAEFDTAFVFCFKH